MSVLKPEYIVVHTAAYSGRNCDRNMIDQWHRDRGWRGIGYHFVIINDKHDHHEDGKVQTGRDIGTTGAHARGLNRRSIGICCIGHGDRQPFTDKQKQSLFKLISDLIDQYDDITVNHVIGHRELNRLIAEGVLRPEFKTAKSCPGNLVDLNALRGEITQYREQLMRPPAPPSGLRIVEAGEVSKALETLANLTPETFPNAYQELREFLTHPEVIAFRS